jgi:chemotaxis protein histidine kinase CheA
MPLDERIQRLSETIIQEVRGPIEEALHRLLADVMTVASEDREQAVQAALGAAAADHDAALAGLREQADRDRADGAALREQSAAEREAALASLHEELDRGRDAALAELRSELEREQDTALADLRAQVVRESEAALAAQRTQLEHERDTKVADLRAQLERERDEAVAHQHDGLTREHEAVLAALREEADRERAAQQQEREGALADAEHAKHDVESRVSALEQELDQARREADEARRAAGEAQRAAGEAQHAGEQMRQDLEQARQDADRAQAGLDQARADASSAQQAHRDEADARLAAEERRLAVERDLHLAHVADRQQELACSDRTLAAFRRLDEARSLTDVLGVLADQAESEIGRAALLLVAGSRLRGWEWRGIAGSDVPIDVPVDPATVFGRAIATGLPVSTSDAPLGSEDDPLAAWLGTPPGRVGLAVPISVGGRAVAILYADDAGDRTPIVPSNWPELAEILARHAGRCLELLTISRASALVARAQDDRPSPTRPGTEDALALADEQRGEESARRYARLLISEIKLYNEPAVDQGRAERDLLTRLGPEIERARRLYEEKIPAAVRRRVDCFDEEVVRTLAGGDAGLLGQW